ncbi:MULTISPECIES: uracil-DNA glycosylase family protein [Halorussus]|uniref:uracil-DNA glycosylase n=1 Tax=Halorussus TaxID=1070314 RepID=UPI000E215AC4|nr:MULTISPECIES: uracil-DNA glycosylase family protein [Halorussus]NHN61143.1 uracil-DNA glycosylase [Halorussus sp. JP-T4]
MAEFPDPESRNALEPGCARCPALVDSRERIAWGNGSLDADVVVVGEAPASGAPDADRWRGGNWTGMAYTSRHSGRRVRDLFADAGLAPGELYFTNAVKCFPATEDEESPDGGEAGENGTPTNREPTAEERANCRDHLATEIERVDPAAVATTGKHATLSVLGDDALPDGFLDSVLDPVESAEFGTTVLPVLHPSYQNVWLPRIGYDREEYVAAIRERIAASR